MVLHHEDHRPTARVSPRARCGSCSGESDGRGPGPWVRIRRTQASDLTGAGGGGTNRTDAAPSLDVTTTAFTRQRTMDWNSHRNQVSACGLHSNSLKLPSGEEVYR